MARRLVDIDMVYELFRLFVSPTESRRSNITLEKIVSVFVGQQPKFKWQKKEEKKRETTLVANCSK